MIGKLWEDDTTTSQPGDLYCVRSGPVTVVQWFAFHGGWLRFGPGGRNRLERVCFLYRPIGRSPTAIKKEARTILNLLRAGGVEVSNRIHWVDWERCGVVKE